MRVLSLFDGISGCQMALKNLNIKVSEYFSSEIDKYAIQVTMKNFPNTIQLGDVTKLHDFDFGEIDLMTWGSPCQDLSIAKKGRQGLSGARSGLFYDAVKIWQRVKPKYWVMENVASMSKDNMHEISQILGVYPVTINSALVTAQQRKRYYWTNIKGNMLDEMIEQPEDRGILLKDVLEVLGCDRLKSYTVRSSGFASGLDDKHNWDTYKTNRIGELGKGGQADRVYSPEGKSVSLSANGGGQGAKTGLYMIKAPNNKIIELPTDNKLCVFKEVRTDIGKKKRAEHRKKTGLDTTKRGKDDKKYVADNSGKAKLGIDIEDKEVKISNTQRYKCLGNSFTVPVIEHILSFMEIQ